MHNCIHKQQTRKMKNKLIKMIVPFLFILGVIGLVNYATEYDTGLSKNFFRVAMYFCLSPILIEAGQSIKRTVKN